MLVAAKPWKCYLSGLQATSTIETPEHPSEHVLQDQQRPKHRKHEPFGGRALEPVHDVLALITGEGAQPQNIHSTHKPRTRQTQMAL